MLASIQKANWVLKEVHGAKADALVTSCLSWISSFNYQKFWVTWLITKKKKDKFEVNSGIIRILHGHQMM